MPTSSPASVIETLRKYPILEPEQVAKIAAELAPKFPEAKAFARQLVDGNWLTVYQAKELFNGRGADLLLGQYVILRKLGEGGMGEVYQARHRRLDRLVALKVIRPDCLNDPGILARFLREARAAARLHHPNIVLVHDADEVNGQHFIAMEYVEGTDLARVVAKNGPLSIGQAANAIRQAALGLQHAHEKGLIHRDIKPSNLMQAQDGTVKVLDMGLAVLSPNTGGAVSANALTQTGTILGTPDFIAPEQARNSKTADIRSDLYSLGGSLYFLLTGKAPFSGETVSEVLLKHVLDEPPPIQSHRADIPDGLAQIVHKLLAKEPAARFQTPAELADALGPFCEDNILISHRTAVTQNQPPRFELAEDSTDSPTIAFTPTDEGKNKFKPALPRWVWIASWAGGGLILLLVGLIAALSLGRTKGGTRADFTHPDVSTQRRADDLVALSDPFDNPDSLQNWQRLSQTAGNRRGSHWAVCQIRDGRLEIEPRASTFFRDYRAELLYKPIEGDFVASTTLRVRNRNRNGPPNSQFSVAGLMARTPGRTPENYVFVALGVAATPGTYQFEYKSTTNSQTPFPSLAPALGEDAQLRLIRIGANFAYLARSVGGNWHLLGQHQRPDLPAQLWVGLSAYTDWPTCEQLPVDFHNDGPLAPNAPLPPVLARLPNLRLPRPDLFVWVETVQFQRPQLPPNLAGRPLSEDELLRLFGN